MKTLLAVVALCVGLVATANARNFVVAGDGYRYSFSDINGWIGIGQDLKHFPQADLVFFAAERDGKDVKIRYPFTDLYMYTNATSGTPERFWKELRSVYGKGSPHLKFVRARDIGVPGAGSAKVVYLLNITGRNRAQAIASVPGKNAFVSLVMEASSEKLLKQNLRDFTRLVRTYRDVSDSPAKDQ